MNYLSLLSRTTCQDPDWPVLMRQSMSVFWSADLSLKSIHPMNPSFDKQAICSQHGSFKASKWIFPTPNNEFEVESALTIRTKLPVFSIYTLSDLHWWFFGLLSRTIQQYSPPSEWIMCELGVFPIFLENDLLTVDRILGRTYFNARKDLEGFNTAFYNLLQLSFVLDGLFTTPI